MELTARLAYVDCAGGEALSAPGALPTERELYDHFLSLHRGPVSEAVDAICRWLQ